MKISILLIIKIMIICLGFQITPISSQRYADSCVKPVDQNQAQDIQSFANETIYYDLYYESNINSFMTIGSGVLEDRNYYIQHPYPNSVLSKGISQEKPGNGEKRWKRIDGDKFVGQVFEQSQRFEWTCPANFYSSIYNESLGMSERAPRDGPFRLRDPFHPVNHNYFINLRLNSDLTVFAGYGSIVVHSVDLNKFTLTIKLNAHFYQKYLRSESIPDIQITNNYGPGKIHIETHKSLEYSEQKYQHRRNILHGGNDKSLEIKIKGRSIDPSKPSEPIRETSSKSGEESNEKTKKKKENWTRSDIFVICGLICFILSLVFLAMPFFVKKENDFHLLEYYDYYQESDELH